MVKKVGKVIIQLRPTRKSTRNPNPLAVTWILDDLHEWPPSLSLLFVQADHQAKSLSANERLVIRGQSAQTLSRFAGGYRACVPIFGAPRGTKSRCRVSDALSLSVKVPASRLPIPSSPFLTPTFCTKPTICNSSLCSCPNLSNF